MGFASYTSARKKIGVGKGFRPPRPPNRACGSSAHGSPVGGFPHRDRLASAWASVIVKSPMSAKKALCASFDAVSSAANTPSFHTEASTHDPLGPWASAPCLALAGTTGASLSLCLSVKLTHPPSCLPSLGAALLSALLAAHRRYGTMKALTPVPLHPRHRSPRFLRHTFLSFRLQPRGLPGHRFTHHASVTSEFRTSP